MKTFIIIFVAVVFILFCIWAIRWEIKKTRKRIENFAKCQHNNCKSSGFWGN